MEKKQTISGRVNFKKSHPESELKPFPQTMESVNKVIEQKYRIFYNKAAIKKGLQHSTRAKSEETNERTKKAS